MVLTLFPTLLGAEPACRRRCRGRPKHTLAYFVPIRVRTAWEEVTRTPSIAYTNNGNIQRAQVPLEDGFWGGGGEGVYLLRSYLDPLG